jgi:hypothetical protein
VFYEDLINSINDNCSGITIGGVNYNVFCYADDILLCSLTATGLQNLIDISVSYIENHGLRFNPKKSSCMIYGKSSFITTPKWIIEGQKLKTESAVTYLGTIFDGNSCFSGNAHTETRVRAAQKAFYALQGAGLNSNGVSPHTSMNIYNVAVRTTLLYGCSSSSISLTNSNIKKLDRQQAKLIKTVLGINPRQCHTTPLLQAVGILPVSSSISIQSLDLLRQCLISDVNSSNFYSFILKDCGSDSLTKHILPRRILSLNGCENVQILKYMFNDSYRRKIKRDLLCHPGETNAGLVDSIQYILCNYNKQNKRLLNILLKAF